jgi:hypothetical protein
VPSTCSSPEPNQKIVSILPPIVNKNNNTKNVSQSEFDSKNSMSCTTMFSSSSNQESDSSSLLTSVDNGDKKSIDLKTSSSILDTDKDKKAKNYNTTTTTSSNLSIQSSSNVSNEKSEKSPCPSPSPICTSPRNETVNIKKQNYKLIHTSHNVSMIQ